MTATTSEVNKIFAQVKKFKAAPVEKWSPSVAQAIDIRIASDGIWYYQESMIRRHEIVKLFSTLLVKEKQGYFLVTPCIKYSITVDDAPFLAVEMSVVEEQNHQVLYFRTNMGEEVRADINHPIIVDGNNNQVIIPYISIRGGLLAKLTRSVYYQLADRLVCKNGQKPNEDISFDQTLGVYSMGVYFALN